MHGGQVCGSWGAWGASVRGSVLSVCRGQGRYLPDTLKGPTRPSATLADPKSSSSNQSAASQSREHDKAKQRLNSPVPCCPDSLKKKKVSFRGTSWKVFLQQQAKEGKITSALGLKMVGDWVLSFSRQRQWTGAARGPGGGRPPALAALSSPQGVRLRVPTICWAAGTGG